MKSEEIKIKDLNDVLKMVEIQRDISVRLKIVSENSKINLEHLEIVKKLSDTLYKLKNNYKKEFKTLKTLNEYELKEINKLLFDRNIKI